MGKNFLVSDPASCCSGHKWREVKGVPSSQHLLGDSKYILHVTKAILASPNQLLSIAHTHTHTHTRTHTHTSHHRRIRITGPVEVQVEETAIVKTDKHKKETFWDRTLKRFTSESKSEETSEETNEAKVEETSEAKVEETSEGKVEESSEGKVEESSEATHLPKIFMVRTENLVHEPFQQTKELKVGCVVVSRMGCIRYLLLQFRPYQRK